MPITSALRRLRQKNLQAKAELQSNFWASLSKDFFFFLIYVDMSMWVPPVASVELLPTWKVHFNLIVKDTESRSNFIWIQTLNSPNLEAILLQSEELKASIRIMVATPAALLRNKARALTMLSKLRNTSYKLIFK